LSIDQYKIHDHVDDFFDDWPYYAVNFKTHLKPDVSFVKKVFRVNGRPTHADYTFGGEVLARKFFTFIDDPDSKMVVYRKEELCYILKDDNEGPKFKIKEWTVDLTNPDDLVFMAEERAMSRGFMVSELKVIVYSAMQNVYPTETTEQIGVRAGEFFTYHGDQITSFIQTGDKSLSTTIAQDMEPDHVTFLDSSSGIPNTSVRQAIIDKVNF